MELKIEKFKVFEITPGYADCVMILSLAKGNKKVYFLVSTADSIVEYYESYSAVQEDYKLLAED